MEEITIYEFQLKAIIEALRLTSCIFNCSNRETCYDRQVIRAYEYAKNALVGEKDKEVHFI